MAILVKEWRAYLRVVAARILLLTIRGIRPLLIKEHRTGNDSNLLIVFYVQIMPDDFVMQLHRF
ncbi:aldehyde dehydrogenase [Escherichia coli]|nr:aldehyde dehydrogenase [Escherichia coli]